MAQLIFGGRRLKANHCNSLPRHVITVCTVTEPDLRCPLDKAVTETFRIGAAESFRLDGGKAIARKQTRLYHVDDFWKLLLATAKDRHTTWIIGHNVLKDFRSLGLPDRFIRSEFTLDWPRSKRNKENNDSDNPHCYGLAVINSPPTIIACRLTQTQSRVVFVDIANYFDCSVRELALAIDWPDWQESRRSDTKTQSLKHCQDTVSIFTETFVGLTNFVSTEQLGMFRYTVASQAMSMFRHGLMPNPVFPHDNDDAKALERRAYIGGRTEAFRKGKISETVYKLDVSSFYPSIMRGRKFPYTLNAIELQHDYGKPQIDYCLLPYIAECEIDSKRAIYPMRAGKRILYPTGRFTTVLAGPELEQARIFGDIRAIRCWTRYKLIELFDAFVDRSWELRRAATANNNKLYADYAKRLSTALYGKFAELSPRWQIVQDVDVDAPWTTWAELNMAANDISIYRSFGYTAMKDVGREEKSGTFPAIAAYVTSYGRLKMNELRGRCKPKECLYQGVDSLIVTRAGYESLTAQGLVSDNELGHLRLQATTDFGEIRGCADYTFGTQDVIAGRPGQEWFDESCELNNSRYCAREGLFTPIGYSELQSRQSKWSSKGGQPKGHYAKDGWWTPYDAEELTIGEESAGKCSEINNSALANTLSSQTC